MVKKVVSPWFEIRSESTYDVNQNFRWNCRLKVALMYSRNESLKDRSNQLSSHLFIALNENGLPCSFQWQIHHAGVAKRFEWTRKTLMTVGHGLRFPAWLPWGRLGLGWNNRRVAWSVFVKHSTSGTVNGDRSRRRYYTRRRSKRAV